MRFIRNHMNEGRPCLHARQPCLFPKGSPQVLSDDNVVRPANYGPGALGKGYATIRFNDKRVTVINLLGRVFMRDPIDNPFTKMDELLEKNRLRPHHRRFSRRSHSEKYADGQLPRRSRRRPDRNDTRMFRPPMRPDFPRDGSTSPMWDERRPLLNHRRRGQTRHQKVHLRGSRAGLSRKGRPASIQRRLA